MKMGAYEMLVWAVRIWASTAAGLARMIEQQERLERVERLAAGRIAELEIENARLRHVLRHTATN